MGFPTCVKCDCNPIGSRFLPGLANNVCYGSSKVSVMRVDRLVHSDRPFRVAFCLRVKTSSRETIQIKMSSAYSFILMQIKLLLL